MSDIIEPCCPSFPGAMRETNRVGSSSCVRYADVSCICFVRQVLNRANAFETLKAANKWALGMSQLSLQLRGTVDFLMARDIMKLAAR